MINYYYLSYFLSAISILSIFLVFYWLKKGKHEDGIFGMCTLSMLCMYFGYISYSHQEETDKNIVLGRYYTNECRLIEGNIDNGFFSSNTNRLSCNGSILNVITMDYDKAIDVYRSNTNKDKTC